MTNVIAIVVPIVLSLIFIAVSFYLYTVFCHRTYLPTQSIGLWSRGLSLGQNHSHHCPVNCMGTVTFGYSWPVNNRYIVNKNHLRDCLCSHIFLNCIWASSLLRALLSWLRWYKMQTIPQSLSLSLHYRCCMVCSHVHQLHLAFKVQWSLR